MSKLGYPITRVIREKRRKQAEERQVIYDAKSLQQKLEALPVGGSKKQRARLEAAIAEQSKPVQVEQVKQELEVEQQNKSSIKKIKKSK
jgi:hypothetical protein